jgi:hypothetical protein
MGTRGTTVGFLWVLYDRRIVPNFHEKFWNLELGT